MKSKSLYLIPALTVFFVCLVLNVSAQRQVKHIVAFKFKPATTPEQIASIGTAFKALKGKIPSILSLESGVNNSTENLNKGFTHIFLLTFASTEARNGYLVHPDHKKFVEYLGKTGALEEPFVVDFEVEK
jgi:Stress responsive A/B Barrel Domain